MNKYLLLVFALAIVSGIFYFYISKSSDVVVSAEVVVTPTKTMATTTKPIAVVRPFSILIVPGHDTNTGGASYREIYERDLVVEVANKIKNILESKPGYTVIVARDTRVWNPLLADYFQSNRQEIISFKNIHQVEEKKRISSGEVKYVPDMATHSIVDATTSLQLYGINKWTNENDVDVVIHLHFNSSERPNINRPGEYRGFTIFIPEEQRSNSSTSRAIAESIYRELGKQFTPEIVGTKGSTVIEDQSLIALGGSNTLTKPALLIEYGYIYEKILRTKDARDKALTEMAQQTSLGIQNYISNIKHEKVL